MKPPDVRVTRAGREDRACLEALFQLYVYDFSELLGLDVGNDGRFDPPRLEPYLTEPERQAFLVRVDEKLAGFVMVDHVSRFTGDPVHDVAQFFVVRKYRRLGVGELVARWLFEQYRGPWEVREASANAAGIAFWRRIIDRYTGGRYEEELRDDDQWHGPVQRFRSE